MKKPSLLIVLLVLFVAAGSEIPELLHLSDNTSNDFSLRIGDFRSLSGSCHSATPPLYPPRVPNQTDLDSSDRVSVKPSRVSFETDLLVLYSVYRT